jgi:putative hemolysin
MEPSWEAADYRAMKDRLDPLITERAPWLARAGAWRRPVRRLLDILLDYDRCIELGQELRDAPTEVIMARMAELIVHDVVATGLENVPRQGPALIVANHPTGIADGIVLHSLLAPIRPDLYVFANSDILKVMPQMETLIAPVEWREDKRSRAKTRATMDYVRRATDEGRLGVIFPSGRLAMRRKLSLHERPWMPSAASIARKFDLPVIPVNLRARNSSLFYLFDLIHPTLRDITLFHETLNKDRQPFRVTVGERISPSALPPRAEAGIEMLRSMTLALGGRHAPGVSILDATRVPFRSRHAWG